MLKQIHRQNKNQSPKKESFSLTDNKTSLIVLIFVILGIAIICGGHLINKYKGASNNELMNQEIVSKNKTTLQNEMAIFEKESSFLDKVAETKNYALCAETDKPTFCLSIFIEPSFRCPYNDLIPFLC